MPTSYQLDKTPAHVIGGWPNGSVAPNKLEVCIDEKSVMECVYRDIELTEIFLVLFSRNIFYFYFIFIFCP